MRPAISNRRLGRGCWSKAIDLPQPTWDEIGKVAAELGVEMPTL